MKKSTLILLSCLFLVLCVLHKAVGAETAAVTELKRTQKLLSDKAEELKAADLAGYSTLMAAVKDLDKYTKDSDITGSKLLVELLTPANLKKLFKAPVRLDKKSGEVSIGYDFSDAATIQDWVVGNSRPEYKKGALVVAPLDKLTHKAQWFGHVTVAGKVALANRLGTHLLLPSGYSVQGATYNAWIVQIHQNGARVAEDTFDKSGSDSEPGAFLPFTLAVQPDRIAMTLLKATAATPLQAPLLGQVSLCGGQGGDSYKDVILTGTLDTNWVRQLLGAGAP